MVKYPELDIRMLEVYHNTTNQETFARMSRQYGISSNGVPTIYIGTTAMIGDVDIKNRFEATILAEKERIASCTATTPVTLPLPDPNCTQESPAFTVPLVIFCTYRQRQSLRLLRADIPVDPHGCPGAPEAHPAGRRCVYCCCFIFSSGFGLLLWSLFPDSHGLSLLSGQQLHLCLV